MSEIVCLQDWQAAAPRAARAHVDLDASSQSSPQNSSRSRDFCSGFENDLFIRHVPSLTYVDDQAWDRLFPGLSEGWSYFRACEKTAPEAFELSAMVVLQHGVVVGAVVMFEMQYRLDMTLGESLKGLRDWIAQTAPGVVSMRIAGLGSPMSEECPIGFDPRLSDEEKEVVFEALITGFEDYATNNGIKVLALKDVADHDGQRFDPVLKENGFAKMASLPVATLPLPFESVDDYLASLKPNMRKDLRRKINKSKHVAVEVLDNIDDVEDDLIALYRSTHEVRKASYDDFDEVPDSYFGEVMRALGGTARVMVFRVEGKIVGFSLFMEEDNRLIGKFIGLDYSYARKYNLYFVNWIASVRYCLDNKIAMMQVGQTTYGLKARLGCKLKRSWIYFKHTGPILGPVFRAFGPHMALDQTNAELQALVQEELYLPVAA